MKNRLVLHLTPKLNTLQGLSCVGLLKIVFLENRSSLIIKLDRYF